ncbi:AbrB/MazE/SpoVT family DNA-binding domain-containing protein [archaeon]|nr:AbrB/MazE/SpoVT family DNA-binding domain-containing protein [archaeon]
MLRIKTKVGERGQIVIPKIIRQSLGIVKNKMVMLEMDDKMLKIFPSETENILNRWAETAEKEGIDVSKKFIYGDELYEDLFLK